MSARGRLDGTKVPKGGISARQRGSPRALVSRVRTSSCVKGRGLKKGDASRGKGKILKYSSEERALLTRSGL